MTQVYIFGGTVAVAGAVYVLYLTGPAGWCALGGAVFGYVLAKFQG